MAMTMITAQDAHSNVLEELLGPELLDLQREATELLDRSLELADLIWELESKYLAQEPCGHGTSLTPITEHNDDDEYDFEELPQYDPKIDDGAVSSDDDDGLNYQLADLRAEAAELSQRSGEAWTLFCEEVLARLSPSSSSVDEEALRRSRKEKRQQQRHLEPRRMESANAYDEKEESFISTTHTEAASSYYKDDDAHLADLYWHSSASPNDDFDSDGNGDHAENSDDGDRYEEEEDDEDDYEFMETIRQEYLDLAEQHLSSQAPPEKAATDTYAPVADGDGKPKQATDAEELPGLFENLMEGKEDGDEDSGFDEDEAEDGVSYLHQDSGFVEGDDTDSDNESFKSCLDRFDNYGGDFKLKRD
ncbi:hypothetical protein PG985_011074 [Apiospora marii]|uniref:Uncharacterized protein n=1 Tax=Apiospora marii TaxID=335849 RepID=A0ABR1SSP8_9PEZI